MEVDSMHSGIEKKKKKIRNQKINITADYEHACKIAKNHPQPYNVKNLTFFKKIL